MVKDFEKGSRMTTTELIDHLDKEADMFRKISYMYYSHLVQKCSPEEIEKIDLMVDQIRKDIE